MSNMVSANNTISKNDSLPQDRNVLHEGNKQEVPWKLMLYKLYGNEAELFLNANMHFKKRLNPRLLKLSGGAGSGPLFKILRNESIQKLLNQDNNLPDDLKHPDFCKHPSTHQKDTYEAYVHQCVAQNRKPVPRVFCAEGNLEKKYSFYQRKPLYEMKQRQRNLMYRLCQKNQDRAQICIFNNPLPNFSNGQDMSDSAVAQYIPHYYLSSSSSNSEKSSVKNKSEELELVPREKSSSGVGETFLTESHVPDEATLEADNKENNNLVQQNTIYRSLETLYDLADTSQYGFKLLYLSHLINYEGHFSAQFQKDPEAPKFLEPSKDIDLKFSREALEAVRMPPKMLPQLVKEVTAERFSEQCNSESSLTAATLLKYLPCPPPKVSLLPPINASRTIKHSYKKGPCCNKPERSLIT